MTRTTLARVIVAAGAAMVAVGVYGMAGWSWGVLAGGVEAVAYGLLLVDVDRPKSGEARR